MRVIITIIIIIVRVMIKTMHRIGRTLVLYRAYMRDRVFEFEALCTKCMSFEDVYMSHIRCMPQR